MPNELVLILLCGGFLLTLAAVTTLGKGGGLDSIKGKTVGDGQHGTARFATPKEIGQTYTKISYQPQLWHKGLALPKTQGIIVGCVQSDRKTYALVDPDDVHAMMIGAAGIGKTAYFLYPNLEFACASGMSFLCTDTKGDLARNYGAVARQYGYDISVIDLRNPTRSDRINILEMVNKYKDLWQAEPKRLDYRAKAEKYAKIIAKTIIFADSDGNFGQNTYFYEAAEGLLSAVVLLVAEFCPPETRHIVSVYKLIQELSAQADSNKKEMQVSALLAMLPEEHKARWFAGSSAKTSEQGGANIVSTAMTRLNGFLDSEMEQLICFDTRIDAEKFCLHPPFRKWRALLHFFHLCIEFSSPLPSVDC